MPRRYAQVKQEKDEIRTQIFCKKKDKEIQRELLREDKAVNSLEDVLKIIRAGKSTHQQQSALSNQAIEWVHPMMKFFTCGKAQHF